MSEIKHITEADGTQSWTVDGKLHRIDGPAFIWTDGSEEWYQHGELHRTDGPAVEWADGEKEWWKYGTRHRLDGPAAIHSDGTKLWFINGIDITKDVKTWLKTNNITYPFTQEEQTQFILTFAS